MNQIDERDAEASQEISLSIDETNKLRTSLGLKPLRLKNDNENAKNNDIDSEKTAEENYAEYKSNLIKERKEKELKEKIEKSKLERERLKKLTGKSIAEEMENEDDLSSWVKKSRSTTHQILSQKTQKAKNKQPIYKEYTPDDLTGLKVAHGLDDVADTGETILVLKDSKIGDEDEDGKAIELVNVNLVDQEKYRENMENQKKKTVYNPYDDNEEEQFTLGKKASILSQYDEQIEGKKKESFVIGRKGKINLKDEEEKRNALANEWKANTVSLDYDKMQEVQDYYMTDEVSFKKSKKKNKKLRQKNIEDADMEETSTPYAYSNVASKVSNTNFVDDDDLQNALARTRKLANRKKKKESVEEEIAKKALKANALDESMKIQDSNMVDGDEENDTLELSTTAEFVRNLATVHAQDEDESDDHVDRKIMQDRKKINNIPHDVKNRNKSCDIEEDQKMRPDDSSVEEEAKMSEEEVDENDGGAFEGSEMEQYQQDDHHQQEEEAVVLEEEPLVSGGMAATLALLSRKGSLEEITDEMKEKERKKKGRAERIKMQGSRTKYTSKSSKDDKDLTFDFQLQYTDEFGRKLNAKEAFRELCHKFHGMKSGKGKTDKKLKRIKEELMLKQASSSDTPMGTVSALQEKTKTLGSAHIVLSKGNRAVKPEENEEKLKVPITKKPLSKPLGGGQTGFKNGFASTLTETTSSNFKPISSTTGTTSNNINNQNGSFTLYSSSSLADNNKTRTKIAFGLNLKRTAGGLDEISSNSLSQHKRRRFEEESATQDPQDVSFVQGSKSVAQNHHHPSTKSNTTMVNEHNNNNDSIMNQESKKSIFKEQEDETSRTTPINKKKKMYYGRWSNWDDVPIPTKLYEVLDSTEHHNTYNKDHEDEDSKQEHFEKEEPEKQNHESGSGDDQNLSNHHPVTDDKHHSTTIINHSDYSNKSTVTTIETRKDKQEKTTKKCFCIIL